MKTTTKVVNNEDEARISGDIIPEVKVRAREALEDYVKYQEYNFKLEDHKVYFREFAGDVGADIETDLGEVVVKKAYEGGEKKKQVSFDLAAFEALPKKDQNVLIKAGVVKIETITTKPGTAGVSFKPKKD